MADDMKMQIILEGVNEAAPAFSDLNKSFESLQTLVNDLSKALSKFLQPLMESAKEVATVFEEPAKRAEQQLSKISEGLNGIDKVAAESANAIVKDYEEAAKKSENEFNKLKEKMVQPASSHGGHENGLFSMETQMNTMYGGMALAGAAAPLDLGIKDAIKSYGDFSQAVANVNSMMGLTPPEVKKLSDQLVELSRTAPAGPTELANALYGIVGAGVPASEAMDVLKTSAEAATAGQTDVSTATSALISVMDSYGLKGKDVAKIADQMFAANAAGAMTFDQFAKSIGTVAGPAAQAGVSFGEVAAATAALTNQGISAQRATEGLRALMMGIMAPTKGAAKEANKLGIEWDQNALKQKGLAGMMQEAMKATGGNSQELKKLIPNIAAWTVAVDLGGKGAESYKQAMNTMSQSSGATGRALQAQEQGFTEQMNHMKNSIQAAQIAFVEGFAPALTWVADKVRDLAQWFQNLSPNTREFLAIAIGLTAAVTTLGAGFMFFLSGIGGVVSGFKALAGAFEAVSLAEGIMDALNPIGWIVLIGAAVIAAAAAIITYWTPIKEFVVKLWDDIKSGTETAWNAITNWLSTTWNSITTGAENIWNGLVTSIQNLWTGFKNWISDATSAVVNGVVDGFKWLYNHNYYFKDLVDFIVQRWENLKNNTLAAWEWIKNTLNTAWNDIVDAVDSVWEPIKTFFSDLWDSISSTSSDAWDSIKNILSDLWNKAVEDAENIWNGLSSFFTGLWNEAYNWGSNLIHMVGQGIDNAIHEVADAAEGVAKKIWEFLGFHSPTKSGPASDSDKWMPNMMHMLAGGITDNIPKITDAATSTGQALKNGIVSGAQQAVDSVKQSVSDLTTWLNTSVGKQTTAAVNGSISAGGAGGGSDAEYRAGYTNYAGHQASAGGVVSDYSGYMSQLHDLTRSIAESTGQDLLVSRQVAMDQLAGHKDIVHLATGGFVTGPTQALIGEGGEPEVVSPLSEFTRSIIPSILSAAPSMGFAGGGAPIVNNYITVQGHVLRESELANIVSRGQWNKMKMQNKFG